MASARGEGYSCEKGCGFEGIFDAVSAPAAAPRPGTDAPTASQPPSVEAVAAALWIVGEPRMARRVLSCVPWADTFWAVNENPLADYALCETSKEIVEAQMAYLD